MSSDRGLPLVRPRPLLPGACIGVCAPSGPVDTRVLHACLEWWREQGYEIRCGDHLEDRCGYLSATDAHRLADFETLLDDPRVDGILCARGGYGIARWLRGLDAEKLRRARKLLIGYSDATLLLLFANQKAGLATIHGPMLEREDLSEAARARLLGLMRGEPEGLAPLQGEADARAGSGVARGPLIGGNLTLIVSSLGTPWEIDPRGAILLIEEITVQPYALDRLLVQLREAGKLEGLAGAAVGQLVQCESERYSEVSPNEAVRGVLAESISVPVVMDLPCGHVADHRALGTGIRAELDGGRGTLTLLESVVESGA